MMARIQAKHGINEQELTSSTAEIVANLNGLTTRWQSLVNLDPPLGSALAFVWFEPLLVKPNGFSGLL
jgi:hypothetical protein